MSIYEHTKNCLLESNFDTTKLEDIADKLSTLHKVSDVEKIYPAFEKEANRLPWPQDHDFGALVLQKNRLMHHQT